ncbi:MAG: acetyl-CoA C-acyltransferase, partial [Gammaproteobacteria bacterium]|nr:acetyl-CoA C-acyltransferase [Gammaproteobacteria bacterium]
QIDDVVIGCAMQEGPQGVNVARVSALLAGLPHRVPGVTVNRLCSSGLQSIAYAAERIQLGLSDLVLAGGVESMSMIPFTSNRFSFNPDLFDGQHADDLGIAYGMGLTAEVVAKKYQISREDQDRFAFESHRRALQAIQNGWFKAEIEVLEVRNHHADLAVGKIIEKMLKVTQDEGPRADSSFEALQKLPPAFAKGGTVTAGNSSQISDGAGIALIMSEKMLKALNLVPIARFCGFAVEGVDPAEMGIGPIQAIPKVLKQVGLKQKDLDWIELNEAFAAQSVAVIRALDLDPSKVNPNGGAIALGHPLGATGTIRAATLLHGLQRINGRYGMVSMCVGVGMGAAAIFERI